MNITPQQYAAITARRTGKPVTTAKIIRTKIDRLNKTERRYNDVCQILLRTGKIRMFWAQDITLRLADDTRYTADFAILRLSNRMLFVEIKGFLRDDALAKFNMAAAMCELWADFVMIQWDRKRQMWNTLRATAGAGMEQ